MIDEQAIIPYSLTDPTGRRVLVLAPHPDDESLGCGGVLALHVEAGDPVKVIFLTDGGLGDSSGKYKDQDYPLLRRREADRAMGILGVKDIAFWGYKDRSLGHCSELGKRILNLLMDYRPELIYAPSPLEYHPDHRATVGCLRQALQENDFDCDVAFYEVATPLTPNHLVDISSKIQVKERAIKCYETQLGERPYLDFALCLNRFRSLTLPAGVSYAEGFAVWAASALRLSDPVQLVVPRPFRLGPDIGMCGPLVSVIVRTKDRPEVLSHALASVRAQSYSRLEVILVNDGGRDVKKLAKEILGDISLRYVNHPIQKGRAGAANSGLKASKGQYVLFLDDDDILYSDHVETLINEALTSGHKIVYSGVKNVFFEGPVSCPGNSFKEEVVFNLNFDADLLLFENYIPFMSVLFHRDVLERVGYLDENMDLFEDWDFLVRVSRQFPFRHVNKITAEYRFYGVSGVEEAHRKNYLYDKATIQAFERFLPFMTGRSWLKHLSKGIVGRLKGDIRKLEEELARRAESIEGYEAHIAKLEQIIDNYKALVAQYESRFKRIERNIFYKALKWMKKFFA